MTQRQRQASGGLSAIKAPPAAAGVSPAPSSSPRSAAPTDVEAARASLWETFYRNASPAQQLELLSLASRQGVLYAHQLPRTDNGNRPAPSDEVSFPDKLLTHLLSGQVSDLQPIQPGPVEVFDTSLDAVQKRAVAAALATPDLCLIQGLPGTGKSRVAAEIVTQAASRGDRVLLLAPGAAAIDRVLELTAGRDHLCPIRCLGRDEPPDGLSPLARAATFAERVRALQEQSVQCARRARVAAEQRCERLGREEAAWPRLRELAAQHEQVQKQLDQIQSRLADLPGQVRQLAEETSQSPPVHPAKGSFAAKLVALLKAYREQQSKGEQELARLQEQRGQHQQDQAELKRQIEALAPLAAAKQRGRWWSPSWWRATFRGNVQGKLSELQGQHERVAKALAEAEEAVARAQEEQRKASERFEAERTALVEAETAARQRELDQQRHRVEREQAKVRGEWQRLGEEIELENLRPAAPAPDAVSTAFAQWQEQCRRDEERCSFARQWATCLEESAEALAARLPGYANLVAATLAALPGDEHFGDPSRTGGQFDLLVLEEADRVTETEFLKVARRARRWVLIGEPTFEVDEAARPAGRAAHKIARPAALPRSRALIFHRLWQPLHCDPRRLPYAWLREQDRLCCRLRHLAPEQRQWLESEAVADSPEIELRILALQRVRPLLAEVVFPPSRPVHEAKQYIYQELQELPVQARDHSLSWHDEPEAVVLRLTDGVPEDAATANLETGVREVVGRLPGEGGSAEAPWYTFRIEFDRQGGWDRRRAEEWVAAHLNLRDLGRTVRLDVPYRMASPLSLVLSDLLFSGGYRVPAVGSNGPVAGKSQPNGVSHAVEFVAVPSLGRERRGPGPGREHDRRRRDPSGPPARNDSRPAGPSALPKAGAGLELDLSAPRHADRLPTELRNGLPSRGIINYLEAQAVVRRLEQLITDPLPTNDGTAAPGIAVVAMYPAQAELIRRLVCHSPRLAQGRVPIAVDVPAAFRHREYAAVVVSLTRSHSHRAVSFGEGVEALLLALTRACRRLILVGDPGTLVRRSHWEGVLDQLDETEAAREGQLVAQLVRYLQGQGRHAWAFHLCEGSGA